MVSAAAVALSLCIQMCDSLWMEPQESKPRFNIGISLMGTYFEVEKPEIEDDFGWGALIQFTRWLPWSVEAGFHQFDSEAKGPADAFGNEEWVDFDMSIVTLGLSWMAPLETTWFTLTLTTGTAIFNSSDFDHGGDTKGGAYFALTVSSEVKGVMNLFARVSAINPEGDVEVHSEGFDFILAWDLGIGLAF